MDYFPCHAFTQQERKPRVNSSCVDDDDNRKLFFIGANVHICDKIIMKKQFIMR